MVTLLIIADAMERIHNLLVEKYNTLLADLMIGYPIDKTAMREIMCLIHISHFLAYDEENSSECLEILAYYV